VKPNPEGRKFEKVRDIRGSLRGPRQTRTSMGRKIKEGKTNRKKKKKTGTKHRAKAGAQERAQGGTEKARVGGRQEMKRPQTILLSRPISRQLGEVSPEGEVPERQETERKKGPTNHPQSAPFLEMKVPRTRAGKFERKKEAPNT